MLRLPSEPGTAVSRCYSPSLNIGKVGAGHPNAVVTKSDITVATDNDTRGPLCMSCGRQPGMTVTVTMVVIRRETPLQVSAMHCTQHLHITLLGKSRGVLPGANDNTGVKKLHWWKSVGHALHPRLYLRYHMPRCQMRRTRSLRPGTWSSRRSSLQTTSFCC